LTIGAHRVALERQKALVDDQAFNNQALGRRWIKSCRDFAEEADMRATGEGSESDSVVAWQRTISDTFYRQDVLAAPEGTFRGDLSAWTIGDLSLSHIKSSPVTYRRRGKHIVPHVEKYHLMTIPLAGELFFEQQAIQSRCQPRCLLAERGDLPYELHQPGVNELVVLNTRLPRGKMFTGQTIGMPGGIAGLFIDLVQSVVSNVGALEPSHYSVVSGQLLDLLGLTLAAGDSAFESSESSVKDAHLRRIMVAVRRQLFDAKLSPVTIAAQCGISVRYLHRLFASKGTSLGRWILEERLLASDASLRNPRSRESIATIAHRLGFADQPQFCRHYKKRFGRTPSDTRALAR
jgi:AraC-like DNA-binding protein